MNLRRSIQRWLGLDSLPSVDMWKAMEQAQRARHNELLAILGRIETIKVIERSQPRNAPFVAPNLDWDTVVQMELAELERMERKKEN